MPSCDMCGRNKPLVKVRIEGAEMFVCERCAKYGSIIKTPQKTLNNPVKTFSQRQVFPRRKEVIEVIVPDYPKIIKSARESMGLTQEQFAKKLNEKTSVMSKLESGSFSPSIDLARKLERVLKITLIDSVEDGNIPLASVDKSPGLTMADFIKDKRKK